MAINIPPRLFDYQLRPYFAQTSDVTLSGHDSPTLTYFKQTPRILRSCDHVMKIYFVLSGGMLVTFE